MIDSNTLLFIDAYNIEIKGLAITNKHESAWLEYVNTQKPSNVSIEDAHIALYEYNIDNLNTTLNLNNLAFWNNRANTVEKLSGHINYTAIAFRKLYEKSNKPEVESYVKTFLYSYSPDDLFCFLTTVHDQDAFNLASSDKVRNATTEVIDTMGSTHPDVIYMIQNIYTPKRLNVDQFNLFEYGQLACSINLSFDEFKAAFSTKNSNLLTNLICMCHTAEKIQNTGMFSILGDNLNNNLKDWFKSAFPEEYQIYSTLTTFELNALDLCTQLTNQLHVDDALVIEF